VRDQVQIVFLLSLWDTDCHFTKLFQKDDEVTLAECTLILSLEVIFASIAVVLSILSIRTHRSIRHLGVGKSFWVPVFVSSVFFFIGSVLTIFQETGFFAMPLIVDVVQVSRILALCILVGGIYGYSRRVRAILAKESLIPKQTVKEKPKIKVSVKDSQKMEAPIQERIIQEARIEESSKRETAPRCQHQLGYLRTLPKDTPIPDECLSCDRVIECKHSIVKTLEPPT